MAVNIAKQVVAGLITVSVIVGIPLSMATSGIDTMIEYLFA